MPEVIKYHRRIFLPEELELEALAHMVARKGAYTLTRHAKERLEHCPDIALPPVVPVKNVEVVEVTVVDGLLDKWLIRFSNGDGVNDICMSYTRDGMVPTVYLNRKHDTHYTLDTSQYATA